MSSINQVGETEKWVLMSEHMVEAVCSLCGWNAGINQQSFIRNKEFTTCNATFKWKSNSHFCAQCYKLLWTSDWRSVQEVSSTPL